VSERPPWQHFQRLLEQAGFRPSRRLGQNFLLDENMLQAIARDARIAPGETVLEVGPGLGFLTRHLLDCGAHLVCIEIDARVLAIAKSWIDGPLWLHGDVLAGKHELAHAVAGALPPSSAWQLVSNLPYSVSAPVLGVLADLEHAPRGYDRARAARGRGAHRRQPGQLRLGGCSRSRCRATTGSSSCATCRPSSSGRGPRSRAASCASCASQSRSSAAAGGRCSSSRPGSSSAAGRRSVACWGSSGAGNPPWRASRPWVGKPTRRAEELDLGELLALSGGAAEAPFGGQVPPSGRVGP
jgi:hypothetical protein